MHCHRQHIKMLFIAAEYAPLKMSEFSHFNAFDERNAKHILKRIIVTRLTFEKKVTVKTLYSGHFERFKMR